MVKRNAIATKLTKTCTQTQKRAFDVAVSPFAIYGPTITVTQLSNLSTWAFPVFYKNILDGGITPDVWLIKVHTYITFESTESLLSFEMTLAQQRLGDHPIHLDIHFGQYFHLKILLGAIK